MTLLLSHSVVCVFLALITKAVQFAVNGNKYSHDLKYQRTIFGSRLRRCIPLDGDAEPNFLFGEFLGDVISLKNDVAKCKVSDTQNAFIIGVCQVSGSGKTRRAFELACSQSVVLIRTLEESVMTSVLLQGT